MLLDAYGTLVELDAPVPRMSALLAAEGHPHPEERVAEALAAEIRHYRVHHDLGRDPATLRALRLECAAVLAEGLGGDAPPLPRLADILVESLRFVLTADARPALEALAAAGLRLAVVSNWDCSLTALLDELGVGDLFGAVSASAVVGAAKPEPAIFADALSRLGVAPEEALHCGDRPEYDCLGAARAGVPAVLIDRAGRLEEGPCPRIRSLTALSGIVRSLKNASNE